MSWAKDRTLPIGKHQRDGPGICCRQFARCLKGTKYPRATRMLPALVAVLPMILRIRWCTRQLHEDNRKSFQQQTMQCH
jgi:hypothetical protein